jgi:hypothetical protein
MESTPGLVFRNSALRSEIDGEYQTDSVSDVSDTAELVFLLALEGADAPDPRWGFWERTINTLVQTFQPNPVLTHVELFLPTDRKGGEVHFSTYLGRHAAWGSEFGNGAAFYMGYNEARWRAIPVMGAKALRRMRQECALEADAASAYSLAGYVFSVPPFRALASVRNNGVGDPAHCAALSARVLSRALPSLNLPCSDAWYGPSTLFIELSKKSRMHMYDEYVVDTTPDYVSLSEQQELKKARETLLSGHDDAVRTLTTGACNMAVKHQAYLVIRERATASDSARMRVLEKGLARMLLRWSLIQNERA